MFIEIKLKFRMQQLITKSQFFFNLKQEVNTHRPPKVN